MFMRRFVPKGTGPFLWAALFMSVVPPPGVLSAPSGDGLWAQYFSNITLTGPPVFTQVEENVNNFWFFCSPDPSVPPGDFSARYTGWVLPAYSEPYTFSVQVSDGARLWVNNTLILNQWALHNPAVDFDSASINLTAGVSVPVTLEYYDDTVGANSDRIQLRWSSPTLFILNGNLQVIIPKTNLFSGQAVLPTPTPQTLLSFSTSCLSPPAVTVDGALNDNAWASGNWSPLPKTVYGTRQGSEAAYFQSRWDSNNLYLAVSIVTGGAPLYTDSTVYLYEDASVETYFDMNNTKPSLMTTGVFQFILRAGDNAVTERLNRAIFTRAVSVTAGMGYNVEMAFPWTTFSTGNPIPFPPPASGVTYGFDLAVDVDRNGACRDSQMMWNGKFKNSSDASAYGNLALFSCLSPTPTRSPTQTLSPTPSATLTNSRTATPTFTWSFSRTASFTPTPTFSQTGTSTRASSMTWTPTHTRTGSNTPIPSDTPTPTCTETATPSDTDTDTFTPSTTDTETNTPTPTETETPSATSSFTGTDTETPTQTDTYTETPTSTGTDTETPTSTETNTPTPSDTDTETMTPTETNTETPSESPTGTITPVPADTPTSSFTHTCTGTSTGTPTMTATPISTASFTPSHTRTPSITATRTLSPTRSPTPSATATRSRTASATFSTTRTPSSTATASPSRTASEMPTSTRTATRTPTLTSSATGSMTPTASLTVSASRTPSAALTPTGTAGVTPPERPYPDPFTPGNPPDDHVTFPLPSGHGPVRLLIADLHRRKLLEISFRKGESVVWDGRDSRGRTVSSGVYIYLLAVDGRVRRGTVTSLR